MENKLNFRRVVLLMKSNWIEGKFIVLVSIGVFIAFQVFLYYISTSKGQTAILNGNKVYYDQLLLGVQPMGFLYGIFICGILTVFLVFKNYSGKSLATKNLILPATNAEKLLTGLIISLIIFPILYCIIFLTIDLAYISCLNYKLKAINFTIKLNGVKQNIPYIYKLFNNPFKQLFGAFLCYQTFTIMGMIHFQKQALLKTLAIGAFAGLTFIFINLGLFKLMIDPLFVPMPVGIRIGDGEVQKLMNNFGAIFINLSVYVVPPIFIITAFFKLKEKQV